MGNDFMGDAYVLILQGDDQHRKQGDDQHQNTQTQTPNSAIQGNLVAARTDDFVCPQEQTETDGGYFHFSDDGSSYYYPHAGEFPPDVDDDVIDWRRNIGLEECERVEPGVVRIERLGPYFRLIVGLRDYSYATKVEFDCLGLAWSSHLGEMSAETRSFLEEKVFLAPRKARLIDKMLSFYRSKMSDDVFVPAMERFLELVETSFESEYFMYDFERAQICAFHPTILDAWVADIVLESGDLNYDVLRRHGLSNKEYIEVSNLIPRIQSQAISAKQTARIIRDVVQRRCAKARERALSRNKPFDERRKARQIAVAARRTLKDIRNGHYGHVEAQSSDSVLSGVVKVAATVALLSAARALYKISTSAEQVSTSVQDMRVMAQRTTESITTTAGATNETVATIQEMLSDFRNRILGKVTGFIRDAFTVMMAWYLWTKFKMPIVRMSIVSALLYFFEGRFKDAIFAFFKLEDARAPGIEAQAGGAASVAPIAQLLGTLLVIHLGMSNSRGKSLIAAIVTAAAVLPRTIKGVDSFIDFVVKVIETVVNTVNKYFGRPMWRLRSKFDNEIVELATAVWDTERKIQSGKWEYTANQKFYHTLELHHKVTALLEIYRDEKEARMELLQLRNVIMGLLTPLRHAVGNGTGFRVQPVAVMVEAPPGVGKTMSVNNLITAILLKSGVVPNMTGAEAQNHIFNKAKNTPYYDGYYGQAAYYIDDWAAELPNPNKETNEFMDIITFVGGFTTILNFAECDKKGMYPFTSRLLLMTTNCTDLNQVNVSSILLKPEAFKRRIAFHIHLQVKKEFRLPDSLMLDHEKFVKEALKLQQQGAMGLDAYPFHMWEYFDTSFGAGERNYPDSGGKELVQLIEEVAAMMHNNSIAHTLNQDMLDRMCAGFATNVANTSAVSANVPVEQPHSEDPEPEESSDSISEEFNHPEGYVEDIDGQSGEVEIEELPEEDTFLYGRVPDIPTVEEPLEPNMEDIYRSPPLSPEEVQRRVDILKTRIMRVYNMGVEAGKGDRITEEDLLANFEDGYSAGMGVAEEQAKGLYTVGLGVGFVSAFLTIFEGWLLFKAMKHIIIPGVSWAIGSAYNLVRRVCGYKNSSEETDFEVDPQSNGPRYRKMPFSVVQQSLADTDVPLWFKIYQNTQKLVVMRPDGVMPLGQVLFLRGGLAVMPYHFRMDLEEMLAKGIITRTTELVLRSCARHGTETKMLTGTFLDLQHHVEEGRDLLFVNFVKGFNPQKDIIKFILRDNEINDCYNRTVRLDTASIQKDGTLVPFNSRITYESPTLKVGRVDLAIGPITHSRWLGYYAHTVKGDCGAPLTIVNHNNFDCRLLAGLHVGRSSQSGMAYATPINQELCYAIAEQWGVGVLREANEKQSAWPSDITVEPISEIPFGDEGRFGSFIPVARVNKGVSAPVSTNLRITPIGEMQELTDEITMLSGGKKPDRLRVMDLGTTKDAEGNYVPAMKLALAPFSSSVYIPPISNFERAVWVAMKPMAEATIHFEGRKATFEEAVLGVPAWEAKSLCKSTSVGYPGVLMAGARNKSYYFGNKDEWDLTTEEALKLKDDVLKLEALLISGERPLFVCRDFLKDEVRKEGKHARLIAGTDVRNYILCRMYFLAFVSALIRSRIDSGICVGLNEYGEWEWLYTHILRPDPTGHNVFDGDFAGFDSSQMPTLLWVLLRFINNWYRMRGASDEECAVRELLFYDLAHSRHLTALYGVSTTIVQWQKSLPSGHFLTSTINSMLSLSLIVSGFIGLTGELSFWENASAATMGDDNIVSVSDSYKEVFNQVKLAKFLDTEYRMVYTAGRKGEELQPFVGISKVIFLQRRFVRKNGKMVCPIRPESFLHSLYYTKKGDSRYVATTIVEGLEKALEELSMHPEEYWGPVSEKLIDIMSRYGKVPMLSTESSSSYMGAVLKRVPSHI